MRKSILSILLLIVVAGLLIPAVASTNDSQGYVATYGETTYANSDYKNVVDTYFKNNANVDLNSVTNKVITASEVNKISSGISQKTYNSNQIFSCALLDLTESDGITITVDSSKITTVTPDMYKNALDSAGISQGHVYVTSPISATGESALAGIMGAYEKATNTEIPTEVKEAATQEIHVQTKIVNDSNVSGDDLANLVSDVKEEVSQGNITNVDNIANIIREVNNQNNLNLSDSNIQLLAESISQSQSVQDQASNYQNKVSGVISNVTGNSGSILDQIFSFINSFTS